MSTITLSQNNHKASSSAASVIVPFTGGAITAGQFLAAAVCLPVNASVASITDSIGGRWIQCGYSYSAEGGSELWYARGSSAATSASVTVTFTSSATVGVNISAWNNVWYVDPLDQWSQNTGTSASVVTQAVAPRQSGDLFFAVVNGANAITGPTGSYTSLTVDGTGNGAGYFISAASTSSFAKWTQTSGLFSAVGACFVANGGNYSPGPLNGVNPQLQFPETLVEMSTGNNFLAPVQGIGVWTNFSSYVRGMTLGPLGRQHELDRVQSTSAQITVNNRDGSFNSWNTSGFLYGGGLDPMTPVKVTAAWNGITYPEYYGYIQSLTPTIADVLNVDVQITCMDILQMLSLKYLSNNNYAQQVISDGGTNLKAFYRLGDQAGNYNVKDSSGNNNTGTLIPGTSGEPAFGVASHYLYDVSTALDVTNGTNTQNGGFETVDYTTQPPTTHNPLGSASSWTIETWYRWTSTTAQVPGGATVFFAAATSSSPYLQTPDNGTLPTAVAVGDTVVGTGIPASTVITAINNAAGTTYITLSNNATSSTTYPTPYFATFGGTGATLFTMSTTAGQVDVRVGTLSTSSAFATVNSYNSVLVGNVTGGVFTAVGASNNNTTLDGNWHHLAITYSSSNVSIYIDGLFDSTFGTGGSWTDPASIIAGCNVSAQNGFLGSLQDAAYYSTVLSAGQIANHYTIGTWFQSPEFGASVGTSNAGRLNKVLSVAGLNPANMLSVPYPFRTYMYAETNAVTTTSALNYLQTQTETEPGLIFQAQDGMIYAYNRQYQYLNPTSVTSQGIFGDSSAATYYYDGPSLQITGDDLDTWNDIQVQSGRSGSTLQEWGPTQSTAATRSASVYGNRTMQGLTSLQQEYDSDALALAQQYSAWYNNPITRVTQIVLNSQGNAGVNLTQMLGLGLMDRITIQYRGQTPGPTFSQDSLIEQISHTVTIDGGPTWVTSWAMSPYEILNTPTYLGVFKFGQPASGGVLTL